MIIPILSTVATAFATISGAAVSAIPVVGSAVATGTASIGAAVGKAIKTTAAGTAIAVGATTTICNIVAIVAVERIKKSLSE